MCTEKGTIIKFFFLSLIKYVQLGRLGENNSPRIRLSNFIFCFNHFVSSCKSNPYVLNQNHSMVTLSHMLGHLINISH